MKWTPREPLQIALPSSRLFTDWLVGELPVPFVPQNRADASAELRGALENDPLSGGGPPLFRSGWVAGWADGFAADLPTDADRQALEVNLDALRAGKAAVVVTGQQPGFLGGPLYTLFKIATAVALARRRSASGRPTVPVFWSGDDDDDLAEAMSPVFWDPDSGTLGHGPGRQGAKGGRQPMIGAMQDFPGREMAGQWLTRVAARTPLAWDLAAIWSQAREEDLSWARLSRRFLARVFTGTGLIIVSGNDPELHRAAGPLYDEIPEKMGDLGKLAAARGQDLARAGWYAQIKDRSLFRPLYRVEGDHRVALLPGKKFPADSRALRPGVLLRSPVQDWLLRPAAVVAGPGELAYLRQLDPVYEALKLPRGPLVPRLFAWLVPAGFDPELLGEFRGSGVDGSELAERLGNKTEIRVRDLLTGLLTDEVGVDPDRAGSLAEGRSRRFRKGVTAMLRHEINRLRAARIPGDPPWVFPDGQRQERRLACACAAALWGDDLAAACVETAAAHLELGSKSDWREFTIEVPDPKQ